MNSRWLWNSHQRHKFLRGKASRDILKFRASEIPFPGFSRGIFHHRHHVVFWEYTQNWEQCNLNVQAFHNITRLKHFTHLNLFKYALNVIQNWVTDASHWILFDGAYILLATMVEGDESSVLGMADQPAVLACYRPLLTALGQIIKLFTTGCFVKK